MAWSMINFDPDAVFGTNVASAFNDDWLNVYANFGWKTGRIDSALTVCLVCSDGHEFEFFYPLTSAEQVQLWNQMDAYADKQELEESIIRRHYGTIVMDSEQPQGGGTSAGGMAQGIQAAPDSRKTVFRP